MKSTRCRACEVTCSYHHEGIFKPSIASLEVHRDEKEGKMTILPYADLPPERKAGRFDCDLCGGEPVPLCVKFLWALGDKMKVSSLVIRG